MALGINQRIFIPSGTIMFLKLIHFELEDQRKCNVLPNGAQLSGITDQDMAIFCQQQSQFIEQETQQRQTTLTEITVPKFDGKNYDDCTSKFNEISGRAFGTYGAPIDYLLRKTNGAYTAPWTTRSEEFKNILSLTGLEFTLDSKMLYSPFV